MKRFALLTLIAFAPMTYSFSAADTSSSSSADTAIQAVSVDPKQLELSFKIEPLTDEQQKAGLLQDELTALVTQRLHNAHIATNSSIMQPVLILRIRTIQSGLDYATFFQLSFQEESMLVRNRSTFNAVTWSQASLLSCRPEDLKKEALETTDAMIASFVQDFIKAYQLPVSS